MLLRYFILSRFSNTYRFFRNIVLARGAFCLRPVNNTIFKMLFRIANKMRETILIMTGHMHKHNFANVHFWTWVVFHPAILHPR